MDYAELIAVAKELIADTGREVTFERLTAVPQDINKPWKGAAAPAVLTSATLPATFVPAAGSGFGRELVAEELLARTSQICLVAPAEFDLATANRVLDGGVAWGVLWVHALRPGADVALWAIGVKQ